MKKLILALSLWLLASPTFAANPTCPTRPPGDSTNACASTAFVTNAVSAFVNLLPLNNIWTGLNTFTQQLTVNLNTGTVPTPPSPASLLLVGADGTQQSIFSYVYGIRTGYTGFRANGTQASPTALGNGNAIVSFSGGGYTGLGYSGLAGGLNINSAGAWTSISTPTSACLLTTPVSSTTEAVGFCQQPSGGVTVGAATDPGAGNVNITGQYQINGVSAVGTVSSVGSGAGLTGGPITSSGSLAIDFTRPNTWTGKQTISADAAFGSGRPWADVTSGSNGCPVAVGNNSTDNTTSIQCQANFMFSTYGGGIVFFPPGNYRITSNIVIQGNTCLIGTGDQATSITNTTSDFTLLTFAANANDACLQGIFIAGDQNTASTAPTVSVLAGALGVVFRDCHIWGGSAAFNTAAVDGYMDNCFLLAFNSTGTSLVSTGANWYQRVKIDTSGATISNGFVQNTCVFAPNVCENHFVMSDFSGAFNITSFQINDVNAITVISDSVFSSPIQIIAAKATALNGNEIGSTTLVANSTGPLIMSGNIGLASITASGSAARVCAANFNITC